MQLGDSSTLAIQAWQQSAQGAQAWLTRHCDQAPQPEGASVVEGVVLWREGAQWQPVALWPSQADGGELLSLAEEVRDTGRGMVSQPDERHLAIGYPVRDLSDETVPAEAPQALLGAVALRIALPVGMQGQGAGVQARVQAALMPLMQRLEDGAAALERDALQRRHVIGRRQQGRLSAHLALLAAVLAEPSFNAAAMQLVTRLAAQFDAERVNLGWRRGTRTRVEQISHSAQFNRKMNRIRATEGAMDEALDQRCSVVWPIPADSALAPERSHRVNRAQATLGEMTGSPAILSVPCLDDIRTLGAVTLERERPFEEEEIAGLESLLALCTRALEEKRRNDRALPVKVLSAGGEQLARFVGPGHLGYKLFALLLAGVVGFTSLATGTDRVAADATLESREQRVMTAPYRGYIDTTLVRPGDRVEQGQPLATMDTRDLVLERLQWQSELAKFDRQEQEMRAQGDRAGINVLAAQREQAQARLALVESRLSRATLVAPFAGLVVSGDLTQRLGGVVEQGEELFRVSPLDGYRLELEVAERRIDDIVEGQRGELVLAAVTGRRLPFVVERITPRTSSGDGQSRFIVEASLDEPADLVEREATRGTLRPGLQGVGKVEIDEKRLIVIWTRELVDWTRLTLWRWWG